MEQQDRSILTIEQSGHVIKYHEFLYPGEIKQCKNYFFHGIEIEAGSTEKPKIPLENMTLMENAILSKMLIEVDGDTQNPLDKLEHFKSMKDYEDVVKVLREASGAFLDTTTSSTTGESQ